MNNNRFERLDRWIFETYSVSDEGLSLFRIFAGLFILFFLIPGNGIGHFIFLSSLPPDFYNPPPGPLALLTDFPSSGFFWIVYIFMILFTVAMLVGYRTRWSSFFAGLTILILQGFTFSVGKVNHVILVPMVPMIMSFSNWGVRFSMDSIRGNARRSSESWPLALLSLLIAFMMLTAGIPKMLGGWLDPSTQAVKGHILNQYFVKGRDALLAGEAIQINAPLLWEMLDWMTILFEVGFILAVWRASWFRIFLAFAVVFHFSTQMMMNISFLTNFLAYSAFLNWKRIYQALVHVYRKWTGSKHTSVSKYAVIYSALTVVVLFSVIKWISLKDLYLTSTDLYLHEFILLTTALAVILFIALKKIRIRIAGGRTG